MKIKGNRQSGFTIFELSVGMTITVILIGAIYGLQYMMGENQKLIFDQSAKVGQANSTMTSIVRELRTARSGDNGAYTIESANPQSLVFYSDVDFDGMTEKVRYFIQGTELKKGVIQPLGYPVVYPSNTESIKVVSDEVRNEALPVFYYFNGNYPTSGIALPTPADPDSIKLIRIHLRFNSKEDDPRGDYVLESNATVRTLKDNL